MGMAGTLGFELGFGTKSATAANYVQYRYPFPVDSITQNFSSSHGATDFGYGISGGDNIPAVADGKVVDRVSGGGLGHRIEIKHADGMYSGYCHMQAASTLAIGANVTRGQTVGKVGHSGVVYDHLHLSFSKTAGATIVGQPYSHCIDPIPYISNRLAPAPDIGDPSMATLIATVAGGVKTWHLLEEMNFRTFASHTEADNFDPIQPPSILVDESIKNFLRDHAEANRARLVQEIVTALMPAP